MSVSAICSDYNFFVQTNLSALEAFLSQPIWLIATIITIPFAIVTFLGIWISARRDEASSRD